MISYLKKIINKITTNQEIIKKVAHLEKDDEILALLINSGLNKIEIINIMEKYYGFNYIDLSKITIPKELLDEFYSGKPKSENFIPYNSDSDEKIYYFALSDITDNFTKDNIKKVCNQKNFRTVFSFAFKHEISNKIRELEVPTEIKASTEVLDDFNAQQWVDGILTKGIRRKASDIHIESLEEGLQVRYRIDGILTDKKTYAFEKSLVSNIMVRTKIISGMDISEKRKAQDGRVDTFIVDGKQYDLRVSTVNTIFGEKVVMRIFDKTSKTMTFSELGVEREYEDKIKRLLSNKKGIIYLAGATGSGKTTTLYTMIDHLNDDEVNIYTIEDPVEKTVKNINQIQVDLLAGVDYNSTLKALLRQDPDIIIVGEVRDNATADLSIRASLTGHLVLTTLHANNALDTVSRLLDMNVEPYLISASALGFMSQRLVRRLCPHCKEKITYDDFTPMEKSWIDLIKKENEIKEFENLNLYKAVGCSNCNKGYSGRFAVIEIFEMNDEVKALISKKEDITLIKSTLLKSGFKTLAVNGLQKVFNGETSIEELMRHI